MPAELAAAAAAAAAAAPAAELQQAKAGFHSSSSALSADLASILSKELKHEKAVAEKSEVVAAVSGMGCNCNLKICVNSISNISRIREQFVAGQEQLA
jgi:hypothetical protein